MPANAQQLWEHFVSVVGEHFRFLETDFAMTLVSTKYPFAKYRSEFLTASIFYNAHFQCELDFGVDRTAEEGRPASIGLSTMMLLEGVPEEERRKYMSPFVPTTESLDVALAELALMIQQHGARVLAYDPETWRRIDAMRAQGG